MKRNANFIFDQCQRRSGKVDKNLGLEVKQNYKTNIKTHRYTTVLFGKHLHEYVDVR